MPITTGDLLLLAQIGVDINPLLKDLALAKDGVRVTMAEINRSMKINGESQFVNQVRTTVKDLTNGGKEIIKEYLAIKDGIESILKSTTTTTTTTPLKAITKELISDWKTLSTEQKNSLEVVNKYKDILTSVQSRFVVNSNSYNEVKTVLAQIEKQSEKIQKAKTNNSIKELISDWKNLSTEQKNNIHTLNTYNNRASAISSSVKQGTDEYRKMKSVLNDINKQFLDMIQNTRRVSANSKSLYNEIVGQQVGKISDLYNDSAYKKTIPLSGIAVDSAIFSSVNSMMGSLRNGFTEGVQAVKDYENGIIDLKRTLQGVTQVELKNFGETALEYSKRFGIGVKDIQSAMTELARAGVDDAESLKSLTETVAIGINTTEIENSADMVGYLISTVKQLEIEMSDSMNVIDSWNYLADKYAVHSDDFAKAIQEAGSASKTFGLDLYDVNAMVTILGEATQASGEKIGTALKSLESRMLREGTVETLESYGIAVKKNEKEFLSFQEILTNVNTVIADLDDSSIELNEIMDALGGTMRKNWIQVLVSDWERFDELVEEQKDSFGYSIEENVKAMDTWEKKLEQLKASWIELFITTANNSGLTQWLKDTTDGITNMIEKLNASGIGQHLLTIGESLAVFAVLEALLNKGFKTVGLQNVGQELIRVTGLFKTFEELLNGTRWKVEALQGVVNSTSFKALDPTSQMQLLQSLDKQLGTSVSTIQKTKVQLEEIGSNINNLKQYKAALEANSSSLNNNGELIATVTMRIQELEVEQGMLNATMKNSKALTDAASEAQKSMAKASVAAAAKQLALNIAISAFVAAIGLAINAWMKYEQQKKASVSTSADNISAMEDENKAIDEQIKKITELRIKLDEGNLSYDDSKTVKGELLEIQEKLIKSYGFESDAINLITGDLKDQIEVLDQLKIAKAEEALSENRYGYENAKKALNKNKYSKPLSFSADELAGDVYSEVYSLLSSAGVNFGVFSASSQMGAFVNKGEEKFQIKISYKLEPEEIESGLKELDNILGDLSKTASKEAEQILYKLQVAVSEKINTIKTDTDFQNALATVKEYTKLLILTDDNLREVETSLNSFSQKYKEAFASGNDDEMYNMIDNIDRLKQHFETLKLPFGSENEISKYFDEAFASAKDFSNITQKVTDDLNSQTEEVNKVTTATIKYNEKIKLLNMLYAEQETKGKISGETYDYLLTNCSELTGVIEEQRDILGNFEHWTLNANEAKKFADEQKKLTRETIIAENATARQVAELTIYKGSLGTTQEKVLDLCSQISELSEVYAKAATNEQFNQEETLKLEEAYDGLNFTLDENTGLYDLNAQSVLDLMNDNYKLINSVYDLRMEFASLASILDYLNSGKSLNYATQVVDTVTAEVIDNNIKSLEEYIDLLNTQNLGTMFESPDDLSDELKKTVESAIEAMKYVEQKKAETETHKTTTPTNAVTDYEASKKKSSEEDLHKKEFDALLKDLEYKRDMDLISEEEFYNSKIALSRAYFANQEKYLDEYRNNEAEYYKWLKSQREEAFKNELEAVELGYKYHQDEVVLLEGLNKLVDDYKGKISDGQLENAWEKIRQVQLDYYDGLIEDIKYEIYLKGREVDTENERIALYKKAQETLLEKKKEYLDQGYSETSEELRKLKKEYDSFADDIVKTMENAAKQWASAQKSAVDSVISSMKNITSSSDTVLGVVVDYIKREKNTEKEALQNELSDINDYYNAKRKSTEDYYKDLEKSTTESYNNQKKTLTDYYDETIKLAKQAYDNNKKNLEDERDLYKKLTDAKKESIKASQEADDYERDKSKKQNSIAKMEAELLALAPDDRLEARARKLELEQQILDAKEDLEKFQKDRSVDLQLNALDKEYEAYADNINAKLELLEAEHERRLELLEAEKDARLEALEAETEAAKASYATQKEAALAELEERYNAETARLEAQIKDIDDYLQKEGDLYRDANALLEKEGQELWDKLMEYEYHYRKSIEDLQSAWEIAKSGTDSYNSGQLNLLETIRLINAEMANLQQLSNSLGNIDSVRTQMQSNSKLWHESDTSIQNDLHESNKTLGESIGAQYKDGRWYLNGVPLYHDGAKKGAILKELYPPVERHEKLIKAAAGEVMFTMPQVDNLSRELLRGAYDTIKNIQPVAPTISFESFMPITFDNVNVKDMDEAIGRIEDTSVHVMDALVNRLKGMGVNIGAFSQSI